MQLLVYKEKSRGKNTAMWGASADGWGVRECHLLLSVTDEVCDPPAGGLRYTQLEAGMKLTVGQESTCSAASDSQKTKEEKVRGTKNEKQDL